MSITSKRKPLVSAIVSTYNSERFIKGKIDDLLEQSIFEDLEIIIVNSGSKQNEDKIIKEYLELYKNIVYVKTEERETVYKAWNRGIKNSSGKFIANSNTDDRLKKNAYELMSKFLLDNPNYGLVYADQYLSEIENQKYDDILSNKKINFPSYNHIYQLERCIIGSQPMWRASVHFEDNIWFNEKFEVCGDHDFELSVSGKYKIHHIPKPLGVFYKSPQKTNKEYENLERNRLEVSEIQQKHLELFFKNLGKSNLREIKNEYSNFLKIPILLYFMIKKIESITNPNIYPRFLFHTVEFAYLFNAHLALKDDEYQKAIKLCRRYLRYKKSEEIEKLYQRLKK